MKGSNGGWKEFLAVYDKKIGVSLSDPARRSTEALIAFLNTFSDIDDLKVSDILFNEAKFHGDSDDNKQFFFISFLIKWLRNITAWNISKRKQINYPLNRFVMTY